MVRTGLGGVDFDGSYDGQRRRFVLVRVANAGLNGRPRIASKTYNLGATINQGQRRLDWSGNSIWVRGRDCKWSPPGAHGAHGGAEGDLADP